MLPIPFRASSAKGRGKSFPIGTSMEGQAMMNSDTERHIGEGHKYGCKSRSNNPSLKRPIGSAAPESNCGI